MSWLHLSNEMCCFFLLSIFILFLNTSVGGVDDVFFSMADMDMSHSLSSLPPLGEPPTVDLDLSLNSNYSASPGESPSGNATVSLQLFDCSYKDALRFNVAERKWSGYKIRRYTNDFF